MLGEESSQQVKDIFSQFPLSTCPFFFTGATESWQRPVLTTVIRTSWYSNSQSSGKGTYECEKNNVWTYCLA